MKRFILYYPLVALSLCLPVCMSCSGEENEYPKSEYPVDALHIVSVNTENVADNNLPTRSITTDVQTEGAQLGIYAVHSNLSQYKPLDGINPATYIYTSKAWGIKNGSEQLRLPKSGDLTAYAWHPVEESMIPIYQSDGNSYLTGINVLSNDDFETTRQTDYLYGSTTVSANSPKATFSLKHALAKITFKVYKSSSLTDEMHLTEIQIRSNANQLQIGESKNMLLKDGTLQGLSGAGTITLTATEDQKAAIEAKGSKLTASPFCLVAPAPSIEYLAFQLTTLTGGQEQAFLTQQTDFSSHRWKAGDHLVITIVLDGMSATVTGMQVKDWGEYTDTYLPIS